MVDGHINMGNTTVIIIFFIVSSDAASTVYHIARNLSWTKISSMAHTLY